MATPLSSIGAALFTDLSVVVTASGASITAGKAEASATMPATYNQTGFEALFVTATNKKTYAKIKNVREFPAVGTPANIVNVPVYGQKIGQSIGGQADAPTLELTINYIANDWLPSTTGTTPESTLGNMIGDGISRVWRFTLMNSDITGVTEGASLSKYDSLATAIGTVGNASYYFLGKMESLLVTPSLTDATTAKISISLQSPFYGAYAL